jgi:uncharacterized membrane protein YphA (DoxX/SURF4 family)
MNILLWVLQILLAAFFLFSGIQHFVLPPGLPAQMAWMYDMSPGLHYFSGAAEILAGLGLVLPGLTRIQTRLTPLAALGLVIVMVGAAVWHVTRSEFTNIVSNVIMGGLAGFVAYGRWRLSPLRGRE